MRGAVRASVGGSLVDDHITEWRQGRTVRLPVRLRRPARYANHGTSDQAQRLQARGIDLLGSVTSALQVAVIEKGSLGQEWSGQARRFVRRAVARTVGVHDGRSAAVVTAVLIGDRAGLDREITERLQQGGGLPRHRHLRREHRGADRGSAAAAARRRCGRAARGVAGDSLSPRLCAGRGTRSLGDAGGVRRRRVPRGARGRPSD